MEDESGEGSRGEYEERFTKLEIQVIDISCNMLILMETLEINFGPFGDFGVSNLEIGSNWKSKDKCDPRKELRKDSRKRDQVPLLLPFLVFI